MRVYEIAKEKYISSKIAISIINNIGISVNNHMSVIPEQYLDLIKKEIENYKNNLTYYDNKSPVKYIKIIKLFGKFDYTFYFESSINIWVAENGKGKTTILNIIHAVLTGNINKLSRLPFEKVIINLNENKYEISKKECVAEKDKSNKAKFYNQQKYIFDYLYFLSIPTYEIERLKRDLFLGNNIGFLRRLNRFADMYDVDNEIIEKIKKNLSIYEKSMYPENLSKIKDIISNNEIFFQTFRRIEADVDEFNISINEIKNSDINFGMRDVEGVIELTKQRLKDMALTLYSEMNGKIINDLTSNKNNAYYNSNTEISIENIKIILDRIDNKIINKDAVITYIENLNTKESSTSSSNDLFLKYYVQKLSEIYEKQKPIDDKIEKFKNVCNKYLIDKHFIYDKSSVNVIIHDNDNRRVELKDLSSGEKQIIAVFTKLYLELETPVIFMIDEPELSLSIEWQKLLLKDIYDSNNVSLLIATTHSPFVFKNELRDYVKDLEVFYVSD